jgi:hypothetical protein
VHTAEGARGYRSLGSFFGSSSSAVSSHVGIDDERGVIGEYVRREDKAWTQANYNPQAVSVELCAAPHTSSAPCGVRWSRAEWLSHSDMLQNVADWIREECQHYGLPIVKLSAAQAQGGGRGVCGHSDLGVGGGNHSDPGPNFPWTEVMDLARRGSPAVPAAPRPVRPLQTLMARHQPDGDPECFVLDRDGTVWHRWLKGGQWQGWQSLGRPG